MERNEFLLRTGPAAAIALSFSFKDIQPIQASDEISEQSVRQVGEWLDRGPYPIRTIQQPPQDVQCNLISSHSVITPANRDDSFVATVEAGRQFYAIGEIVGEINGQRHNFFVVTRNSLRLAHIRVLPRTSSFE